MAGPVLNTFFYSLVRMSIVLHTCFITEPVIASLRHRQSIESGTVVMETPMTASVSSKKMSAAVLFTLEGMELVLYQEIEVLGSYKQINLHAG